MYSKGRKPELVRREGPMEYRPHVNTNIGPGRLFRIDGNMAHVEFDYMYLVEIPITDVDLDGIDPDMIEGGVNTNEALDRGKDDRKGG
jgi:hypothetical protein